VPQARQIVSYDVGVRIQFSHLAAHDPELHRQRSTIAEQDS
jgi:hypothetical protein